MLGLGAGRDTQHLAHSVDLETDAVTLDDAVELAWRQHLRTFEPPSVAKLFLPLHILQDCEWQQDQKDRRAPDERRSEEGKQAGSAIDNILHVIAKPNVGKAA